MCTFAWNMQCGCGQGGTKRRYSRTWMQLYIDEVLFDVNVHGDLHGSTQICKTSIFYIHYVTYLHQHLNCFQWWTSDFIVEVKNVILFGSIIHHVPLYILFLFHESWWTRGVFCFSYMKWVFFFDKIFLFAHILLHIYDIFFSISIKILKNLYFFQNQKIISIIICT